MGGWTSWVPSTWTRSGPGLVSWCGIRWSGWPQKSAIRSFSIRTVSRTPAKVPWTSSGAVVPPGGTGPAGARCAEPATTLAA